MIKSNDNKSILINCVNYNSYNYLKSYLTSIDKSANHVKGKLKVDIIVSDNSEKPEEHKYNLQSVSLINILFNRRNLGYMGGITSILENVQIVLSDYDYFIISNVDLTVSEDFFEVLLDKNFDNDIGWIAPQIFSYKEQKDRNPAIISRPSKQKLQILKFMFTYPLLNYIYVKIIYPFKNRSLKKNGGNNIYAGHGSFMLFTRNFTELNKSLEYPMFLYGEEIFLAELNRNSGLRTVYIPELKIWDIDHVSTGLLKRNDYCRFNRQSLDYLIKKFF